MKHQSNNCHFKGNQWTLDDLIPKILKKILSRTRIYIRKKIINHKVSKLTILTLNSSSLPLSLSILRFHNKVFTSKKINFMNRLLSAASSKVIFSNNVQFLSRLSCAICQTDESLIFVESRQLIKTLHILDNMKPIIIIVWYNS